MPPRIRGRNALGAVVLIIGLLSLGSLPAYLAGLALIVFGFALLVAEVVILPGSGVLVLSGLASISIGALLLMHGAPVEARLAPWGLVAVLAVIVGFYALLRRGVLAVARRQPTTGREGMLGEEGVARQDLAPDGQVFVHGELWEASSPGRPIPRGSRVRVVGLEGLRLFVEPVSDEIVTERYR